MDNTTTIIVRVIAEYKGMYKVRDNASEYLAQITGGQIFKAITREDLPIVGDWVVVKKPDVGKAIILKILPRKAILKTNNQVIASNIDVAFVIESIDRDFNLNRFERYFVLAKEAKIKPVIILNKIDLISEAELEIKIDQIKSRFPDIDAIMTSTINQQGLTQLLGYIEKGKTYCFLGSSGVGKSSLINKLLNAKRIKTAEISNSVGRGRHTTTSREMYFLDNGAIVIDNPGMREVGIADSETGVNDVFSEIIALAKKCKFSNCAHKNEPGCAVQKAIKGKTLDENKFHNYLKLKKEDEYLAMSDFEKRDKKRKFGKFIKKAKEEIYGYKGNKY
jgi:ribosome biogenesis GTPase